jgi:hypothetical protein
MRCLPECITKISSFIWTTTIIRCLPRYVLKNAPCMSFYDLKRDVHSPRLIRLVLRYSGTQFEPVLA